MGLLCKLKQYTKACLSHVVRNCQGLRKSTVTPEISLHETTPSSEPGSCFKV